MNNTITDIQTKLKRNSFLWEEKETKNSVKVIVNDSFSEGKFVATADTFEQAYEDVWEKVKGWV